MKKNRFLPLFLVVALLGGMSSCNSPKKQATNFLEQLHQAIAAGDKATITTMYPTAVVAEALNDFDPAAAQINVVSDDSIVVALTDKMDITLARDAEGTLKAVQSHGLFSYEPNALAFALSTGQYKPTLDDGGNAARMADSAFVGYLSGKVFAEIKKNVSVHVSQREGSEYWMVVQSATVTNNNDFDLGGDDYVATVSGSYFDTEQMRDVRSGGKSLTGKPIPAHSSVTYSLGVSDFEGGVMYRGGGVTIKSLSPELVKQVYTPSGTEYEDYLNMNK